MTCQTCTDMGRKGYCAPLRCYCGHELCHAFASWSPLTQPENVVPIPARRNPSAWAKREESTWIDKL